MKLTTCKTCPFWEEIMPGDGEPDEERLGSCNWNGKIPYAWRWAPREVVQTTANEGTDCPCHPDQRPLQADER